MLTNLKWGKYNNYISVLLIEQTIDFGLITGLTWITSQLPDDMTTSNAIPTSSTPTITSPK